MTKSSSVFLSHNKLDREVASNVAIFLASENLDVWFDEWEISAGDSIIDEIQSGLHNCSHFVIIWSKNANKSQWVNTELKSALTKAIKTNSPRIIPLLLDDTPKPPLLEDVHHIKYEGGTEQDRENLIESITGNKPSMNFVRAIVKKYHEVIYDPNAKDPFGVKFCPTCGSDKLKGSSVTDYAHDEEYFILSCQKCNWSTWTQ